MSGFSLVLRLSCRFTSRALVSMGDGAVEQIAARCDLVVLARCEPRVADVWRLADELIDAVGIVDGERPEHVGVEDREQHRHEPERHGMGSYTEATCARFGFLTRVGTTAELLPR